LIDGLIFTETAAALNSLVS